MSITHLINVSQARAMYETGSIVKFRFLRVDPEFGGTWFITAELISFDSVNPDRVFIRATHGASTRQFRTLDAAINLVETITGKRMDAVCFIPNGL
jgi:hypothetical protein